MFYNLRFGPYLEVILFAVGGIFLILTLLLVIYLLISGNSESVVGRTDRAIA
jgi:hypothetical protein